MELVLFSWQGVKCTGSLGPDRRFARRGPVSKAMRQLSHQPDGLIADAQHRRDRVRTQYGKSAIL